MKTVKGTTPKAWVVAVYGVPGCGKSTLATYAPNPIFLDIEGGLDRVDCVRYQADDWDTRTKIETWDELRQALFDCMSSDFQTVVIDTMSAVEELMATKICAEHDKPTLADFAYGAGYAALFSQWMNFMKCLYDLKNAGRNVLCIAHDQIEDAKNPSGENWERYAPNIHKKSVAGVIGKMDAVLFAHYEKQFVTKQNDKKIAVETGRRLLQTVEKPYCIAKNRFGMPEQLSFTEPNDARQLFEVIK